MANSCKLILAIASCISFIFLSETALGAVVISEIMYDPDQCSDSFCEWVELYNAGDASVNLTGWTVCGSELLAGYVNNSDGNTYANTGMNITGKGFAIITDGGTGTSVYGNFTVNSSSTALHTSASSVCGGLSNTGEAIYLNDSSGALSDLVNYSNSWGANGNNKTLERIDPTGTSDSSTNWKEGNVNGTPGSKNSVTPTDHDLAVYTGNITFSPADPSPRTGVNISFTIQNNGISNETNVNISIYNISGSVLTMIRSQLSNITKQSSVNTTIQWNNTVKGNSTVLVRIENFSDDNATNNNATKIIPFDFHLVINEIMYNPPEEIGGDADFEWLEIYNNATYAENLTGWTLRCDSSSKSLTGSLNSNSYLVFAKDKTQFYTYYSSSTVAESQTCSLNNDGDTIKLIFNDSGIYHEEAISYSPSWGGDGTGYTLEKRNPTTDNNSTNWGESKAYSGTPGVRNNPDSQIKSSLKNPTVSVVYRSTTETVYLNSPETPDYKIVSSPELVHVNEPFKAVVSLKSAKEQIVSVYSYVYDGKILLSEGFDGNTWKARWTANKKDVKISPTPVYVELENRIKLDTPPGQYKFKIRIKDETDLVKDIDVLPEAKEVQSLTESSFSEQMSIYCEKNNSQAIITITNATTLQLLHFSKEPTKNETLDINGSLAYMLNLVEGYNSVILVADGRIVHSCDFSLQKSSVITGRTTQVISLSGIINILKSWLEKLTYVFRI